MGFHDHSNARLLAMVESQRQKIEALRNRGPLFGLVGGATWSAGSGVGAYGGVVITFEQHFIITTNPILFEQPLYMTAWNAITFQAVNLERKGVNLLSKSTTQRGVAAIAPGSIEKEVGESGD